MKEVLFAAFWPWKDENTVSIRVGAAALAEGWVETSDLEKCVRELMTAERLNLCVVDVDAPTRVLAAPEVYHSPMRSLRHPQPNYLRSCFLRSPPLLGNTYLAQRITLALEARRTWPFIAATSDADAFMTKPRETIATTLTGFTNREIILRKRRVTHGPRS